MGLALAELSLPHVYDADGHERHWAWLVAKYPGTRYLPAEALQKFRLTTVRETVGPAAIVVQVRDMEGRPWRGYVGLYWPNPEHPLSTEGAVSRWQPYVGAAQRTDEEGLAGFGIGGGSVIREGKGPHWAWVLSPTVASDALADFGWLGGTDHAGPLRLEFALCQADEPQPAWRPYELRVFGITVPVDLRPR